MEYQKIINFWDITKNQPFKFRTNNWVEIKDDLCGKYNTNSQIKFKNLMLKSSLCHYKDVYILVKGTKSVASTERAGAVANGNTRQVIFRSCAPFTNIRRFMAIL